MKYFGYMTNDFINGKNVCVSLWTAGCPHRCPGCHNPHMQSFDSGYPVPEDLKWQLLKALSANGITRNFSVLGGEPLCQQNLEFVASIIRSVRLAYPAITIYVWTGYTLEQLKALYKDNEAFEQILNDIDILIDGPYIDEQRDVTLDLRGSPNQRILHKGQDF